MPAAMTEPSRPAPSLLAARRTLRFAWAADRRLACWTFALLTGQAVAASLAGLWLRAFADAAAARHYLPALLAGLAIALSLTIAAAVEYAGNRTRMSLSDRTQYLLNRRLLEIIGRSPTLAIHQTPAHLRELELLQLESWEFAQAVPALIEAITIAVQVVVTVALLASISPLMLILPLFGLPALALSRQTAGLFNLGNELAAEPSRRAEMLYYLAANSSAAAELRLFRLQAELMRRFGAEHAAIRGIHVGLAVRGQLLRLLGRSAFLAGYLGALALVTYLAARRQVSIGTVAMTAVLAGQVLILLTGSAEHAQWLRRTLTTAARQLYLEQVAAVPVAERQTADAPVVHLPASKPPVVLRDGIRLEAVSYRYPGRVEPAIRDLTAWLPAAATVALVGDNGAGKSTLVGLLAGLCRPDSGQIQIDGTNLADLDPEAWRLRISAGFQDHARFEFTIQRAVGLGLLPRLDDQRAVSAALHDAAAADVARSAPAGLRTQLGAGWPGGVDLSGGQWQKLAIGRAMMRPEPLLLLLDEPTAAIDAEAEHELFARWTRATRASRQRTGAITVLVSHRLATVRTADLILVLQDGRICEQGSHSDLMDSGGRYAALFDLQARAYRYGPTG